MKTKRIEDRKLLDTYHSMSCLACGTRPCDPCHIHSVGAFGPDTEWNVIPLCRVHHTQQHKQGWLEMNRRYVRILMFFKKAGWYFNSTGRALNDRLAVGVDNPLRDVSEANE